MTGPVAIRTLLLLAAVALGGCAAHPAAPVGAAPSPSPAALRGAHVLTAAAPDEPDERLAVARDSLCPRGTAWDGSVCGAAPTASGVECVPGAKLVGRACAPSAAADCPPGARFEAGRGCVRPTVGSEPTEADVRAAAKTFYETEGEFRGQYIMSHITAVRTVRLRADAFEAHVRYEFRCVTRHCCCGERGFDQRVFRLERQASAWRATWMGEHLSGRP